MGGGACVPVSRPLRDKDWDAMPNTQWKKTERASAVALAGEGMADMEAHVPALEIHLALELSGNGALVPGSREAILLCRNLETLAPYVLWMMRETCDCTGELRVRFTNAYIPNGPGVRPKRMID